MKSLPRAEFRRLTGLTQHNFEVLYTFLGGDAICSKLKYNYRRGTPKRFISGLTTKDRLFMTLVRLRRGFSIEDIALLFGTPSSNALNILFVWVQLMYCQFKRIEREMCTSRHDQKKQKILPCYNYFKNFRLVLDLFHIKSQTPYHYQQQGNTWSAYKSDNISIYLIGTNAFGSVAFISPAYEGAMSDRELFKKSGLQTFLEEDDLLLVDRGLQCARPNGFGKSQSVAPPFPWKKENIDPEEALLFKMISHARVHVKRAIRKIKCFHVLQNITNLMLPILDHIVYVCGCLVNFDPDNIVVE